MRVCGRESPAASVSVKGAHASRKPEPNTRSPAAEAEEPNTAVTSIASTIIPKLGRNKISVAVSVLIFAVAAFTLYRLLRDVDFDKVVAAIEAQSLARVAIAGGFVVAGYVTLTFYDVFALRIDRLAQSPLPGRRARELHLLDHRPQSRRCGAHRRPDPPAHLFGLGIDRRRRRQDRLDHRHDVRARQRVPARRRGHLCAAGRERGRSSAAVDQPHHRALRLVRGRLLSRLARRRARAPSAGPAGASCCPICGSRLCRSRSARSI